MTRAEVQSALRKLPVNSPNEALDLYRRARAAGVASHDLAKMLLNLQDDWRGFQARLAAIDAEFDAR